MATHGTVKPFNAQSDDWPTYIERLQHYFIANDVEEESKKRSILLTVCGATTYKLIRSLAPAGNLDATSYGDMVKLVKDHYNPKPSPIVQRFHFNSRSRAEGESVASFVAALRELALHCDYGDRLSEMLRDRLVHSVNHKGIQRRLLAEPPDLTFEKAFSLAQALEASEQNVKALDKNVAPVQDTPTPLTVNQTRSTSSTHATDSRKRPTDAAKRPVSCYRCGGPHLAPQCRHIQTVCRSCKKRGHLARVCRGGKSTPKKTTNYVAAEADAGEAISDSGSDTEAYDMFTLSSDGTSPYRVDVFLNGVPVQMELDTGASLTVITETTYNQVQQQSPVAQLQPTQQVLKSYTGHSLQLLGHLEVDVRYGGTQVNLPVHVVAGNGPNLLGRDWLPHFDVDLKGLKSINSVTTDQQLSDLLEQYSSVFTADLGCVRDSTVTLSVNENAKPRFYKPRSIPHTLKEKVELELESLRAQGIISPVKTSSWAAPVVPVVKKNGKIRLCGDYKLTINQASPTETYPLPRADEIYAKLAGGKLFTKLDMSNAYLQLPLDAESRKFTTINTHRGLFEYTRLPFGVASAPAIFQRYMDTLLQGIPRVSVYIDDILIAAATVEEHLHTLELVLQRLREAGLRLNRSKCLFLQASLDFLGHVVNANGIQPTEEKVRAIKEASEPKNAAELRSFLGLVNYYSKFLPNLSTKLAPLYKLLNKKQRWIWGTEQQQAFREAQDLLQADSLLAHYDPSKPLVVACDASQYGIGAVLSHVIDDETERPVAYVSRTLSTAEKHYSQLEKEALAIIFAVKKFHYYIYGRSFAIESDHRPLMFLFGERNGIPQMASSRIQRWALTLSAYTYTIRYRPGKHLSHADALSRLPCADTCNHDGLTGDLVLLLNHLSSTTVSAASVKQWTSQDPTLSCVRRFIETGWPEQPEQLSKEFQPYVSLRLELSVLDGCILRGSRVVIPPPGRQLVLDELHDTHTGITKMKSLARSFVWWPGMDAQIEKLVKSCTVCQESRPSPAPAPLHPWEWPSEPWSRIHIDFAGPFLNHMFMIVVDAHSKWIEASIMSTITATKTIEQLRIIFATHGLPRKVVTDNGTTFTSEQFRNFMSLNGISHVTTAPYHPSSNGLAERAVQTVKHGLKRTAGSSLQERLSKFLFTYRITPQSTTGVSPSTLLMGRRLRSRLDRLFPDVATRVETKQKKQAEQHDSSKPLRKFKLSDTVYVKDFRTPSSWIPGKIVKVTGPLSYHVELVSGRVVRRHVDAIRTRSTLVPRPKPTTEIVDDDDDFADVTVSVPEEPHPRPPPPQVRRSARSRARPDRLGW